MQEEPRGTGDAVRCAREALADFDGDVLVLNGDVPALRPETLARARRDASQRPDAAATVLSFEPADAAAYGRIVRDANGALARIVEARDASPEELALGEVNSGIYVFAAAKLWPALERLDAAQRAGRALRHRHARASSSATARRAPSTCADDPLEADGINTRAELAAVTARLRDRINTEHMLAGVTIVDPLDVDRADVEIEPDVDDPSVHRASAATVRIATRRRDRPVRLDPRAHRARPAEREGRHVRRAEGARASARARRSRTSPTSATPRSARTRTSPPATSPRTSATTPASRRNARRSAATSGPESTIRSSHLSRLGTMLGLRRAPS